MKLSFVLGLVVLVTHTTNGQEPVIHSIVLSAGYAESTARFQEARPDNSLPYWSSLTIFGENLADFEALMTDTPRPVEFRGVRVEIETFLLTSGRREPGAAALLYVSPKQINIHIPYFPAVITPNGIFENIQRWGDFRVIRSGRVSAPFRVLLDWRGQMGAYTLNGMRDGPAAAWQAERLETFQAERNPDYLAGVRLNSPSTPAHPGEWVAVFVTGVGSPNPIGSPFSFPAGQLNSYTFYQSGLTVRFVGSADSSQFPYISLPRGFIAIQTLVFQVPPESTSACFSDFVIIRTGPTIQQQMIPVPQRLTLSVAKRGETCDGKPLAEATPD
jgi:uncharacterized protein (TIGR03437 family)